MQTAVASVLNLPEILEQIILSAIPPQIPDSHREDPRSQIIHDRSIILLKLILSQRVSRLFHEIIQSSPSLQRALFLLPSSTPASGSWTASLGTHPSLNPILQVAFQWRYSHLPIDGSGRYQAYMVMNRPDVEVWCKIPGSWKRLLLSQPPITDVAAVVWDREDGDDEDREEGVRGPVVYEFQRISDEDGIRLGLLLEKVVEMFEKDRLMRQIKICSV